MVKDTLLAWYVYSLSYWAENQNEIAATILLAVFLLYVCCLPMWDTILHRHRERMMSRAAQRERRAYVKARVEDIVSNAIETDVSKGGLTREEASYWYERMGKAGLHHLGHEPTMGEPLWQRLPIPNPIKIKRQIWSRLGNGAKALFSRKRREPTSIKDKLQQVLSRNST